MNAIVLFSAQNHFGALVQLLAKFSKLDELFVTRSCFCTLDLLFAVWRERSSSRVSLCLGVRGWCFYRLPPFRPPSSIFVVTVAFQLSLYSSSHGHGSSEGTRQPFYYINLQLVERKRKNNFWHVTCDDWWHLTLWVIRVWDLRVERERTLTAIFHSSVCFSFFLLGFFHDRKHHCSTLNGRFQHRWNPQSWELIVCSRTIFL